METGIVVHHGELPKAGDSIRFVCMSDSHNEAMNIYIPDGDVFLHAGDFTRKGTLGEVLAFESFLRNLPHKHKVVIAGNHEYSFDFEAFDRKARIRSELRSINPAKIKGALRSCVYLEDTPIQVCGYKIWGSPWTSQHNPGAFTVKDKAILKSKWDMIPDNIDILITHSPPFGICDSNTVKHFGSVDLREKVERIKPIVHMFGHIHEGYGYYFDRGTTYLNCAMVNKRYAPVHTPWVFDLPKRDST
jgi:Icc-related predicted phosphoesterase